MSKKGGSSRIDNRRGKMDGNLDRLQKRIDYLIICEGYEEYDYINTLKKCGVWRAGLGIETVNAGSLDRIRRAFSDEVQKGWARNVVVFCDTEGDPHDQFKNMKKGIADDCGFDPSGIVFFANPNSMQVILLHFGFKRLKHHEKQKNWEIIEKMTGVPEYMAHENQRKSIMDKIEGKIKKEGNYTAMRERLKRVSGDDFDRTSTTNVGKLFDKFE